MYPAPGVCPVCGHTVHIVRLQCAHCGTAVEGTFALPSLARLAPEHQQFVEIFVRAEGKLNRVQDILGISYPTARARLLEVIRALGYEAEAPSEPAVSPEERQAILDDLAAGRISVKQAIERMQKGEA